MLKSINKTKVKTFKQLQDVSTTVMLGNDVQAEHLLVPMGVHGLSRTIPICDEIDEYFHNEKIEAEDKKSRKGTILLIG